jgi:hypothetical protein
MKKQKKSKVYIVSGRKIFQDKTGRWRYVDTKFYAPNPTLIRCIINDCNGIVRNFSQKLCPKHVDWTKTAHGSSILIDEDVVFISASVLLGMKDYDIADKLLTREHHKNHKRSSLWRAIQHHRRKYLMHRYTGKFFYKTIKKQYREAHLYCEYCGWREGAIDVHHILQIKDFDNEADYHLADNMICLCPNHHRVFEELRKKDFNAYNKLISIIRSDIEVGMTDKQLDKQPGQLSDTDILITETVLKVAALEKLLVSKGIIVSADLTAEMKKLSEEIVETMRKTYLNKKD